MASKYGFIPGNGDGMTAASQVEDSGLYQFDLDARQTSRFNALRWNEFGFLTCRLPERRCEAALADLRPADKPDCG